MTTPNATNGSERPLPLTPVAAAAVQQIRSHMDAVRALIEDLGQETPEDLGTRMQVETYVLRDWTAATVTTQINGGDVESRPSSHAWVQRQRALDAQDAVDRRGLSLGAIARLLGTTRGAVQALLRHAD